MEHFLVCDDRAPAPPTYEASPRFHPATDADGALFIEGPVFRLSAGEPHLGAEPGRAVLERVRLRGPEALAELVGDFVACLTSKDATYAFKSFTSQYQLYLHERTLSNRLVRVVGSRAITLDHDYFVRHVLLVPGMQFHMRRTPLRGVERVLPGELLTIGERVTRRQLVRRTYAYRLDREQRREDVAPEIASILRTSVRDHLAASRGAATIELSGGLDSSFIACLVGETRPGTKAVMFSRPDVPSHGQSETYARGVAERYGLDLLVLAPEDLPSHPEIAKPPYGDEPSDFFWFGDLFSRAVAQHTGDRGTVFTGFGADQLFLRSPAFLPYLLGRRAVGAFGRNLRPVGRLTSRSPLHLALQSALSQIPRGLFYKLAKPFATRRFNPMYVGDVNLHRTLYEPVPWLPASASQEEFEAERLEAETRLVGNGIICDDWGYFSASTAVAAPHFEPRAIVDASPYCDLRLIDFVYGKVSALLVHDFSEGARYKELLREAQKGIVPDDLRARKNDMFVFNSFLGDYMRKGREDLLSLLDEVPDGLVDLGGARRAFEELAFGVMNSSTRSLIALFGYLIWQRAFRNAIRH